MMEGQNIQGVGQDSPKKENKANVALFKWVIVVLLLIIGGLTYLLFSTHQSYKDKDAEVVMSQEENLELQIELDELLGEYTMIKHQYDSVLVDKDMVIQEKTKEIEKLIAQQADYWRIRRQLDLLRDITQNYVREIDSLHTENKVLKAENVRMQDEIQKVTEQTAFLSQTKTDLEEKVEMASTLRAFQISATAVRLAGFRKAERETDSARRTEKIKICFTVAENPLANAGTKNIYARISGPDNEVLRISDDDRYSFIFQDDTLQYSAHNTFEYQNRNVEMCLYWDNQDNLVPGSYLISLFTDDVLLGETLINLK